MLYEYVMGLRSHFVNLAAEIFLDGFQHGWLLSAELREEQGEVL